MTKDVRDLSRVDGLSTSQEQSELPQRPTEDVPPAVLRMSLPELLREAVTVLDEPFHREAVAAVLLDAADTIERERLDHQETRGAVAAWKQYYAQLQRTTEINSK